MTPASEPIDVLVALLFRLDEQWNAPGLTPWHAAAGLAYDEISGLILVHFPEYD